MGVRPATRGRRLNDDDSETRRGKAYSDLALQQRHQKFKLTTKGRYSWWLVIDRPRVRQSILHHMLLLLLHINLLARNKRAARESFSYHSKKVVCVVVLQQREKLEGLGAPLAEFGPQAAASPFFKRMCSKAAPAAPAAPIAAAAARRSLGSIISSVVKCQLGEAAPDIVLDGYISRGTAMNKARRRTSPPPCYDHRTPRERRRQKTIMPWKKIKKVRRRRWISHRFDLECVVSLTLEIDARVGLVLNTIKNKDPTLRARMAKLWPSLAAWSPCLWPPAAIELLFINLKQLLVEQNPSE